MQDEEGGAYHKLTSMHADFMMPEEDKSRPDFPAHGDSGLSA